MIRVFSLLRFDVASEASTGTLRSRSGRRGPNSVVAWNLTRVLVSRQRKADLEPGGNTG